MQTAVSFATMRVKRPDEDDWGKLKRILKYLNGTRQLTLKLSMDTLGMIKWFVDGSHNTHWDCKGHGGAMLTFGEGAVPTHSRKVKLNTKRSTETELVVADAYLPEVMWSLYFIREQGHAVEHAEIHQDNISAQMLKTNGRSSSRRKTKHIKAKFFFIKDKVDIGEVKIVDCPTDVMWVDMLTKPVQGKAFRVMRSKLMNCAVNYVEEKEVAKTGLGLETKRDKVKKMVTKETKALAHIMQKALVKQASYQDDTQLVQKCVEQCAKSGLCGARIRYVQVPHVGYNRTPRYVQATGRTSGCNGIPKFACRQTSRSIQWNEGKVTVV